MKTKIFSDCNNLPVWIVNIIISVLVFVIILYYNGLYARYYGINAVSIILFIIVELIPVGFVYYNVIEMLEEKGDCNEF